MSDNTFTVATFNIRTGIALDGRNCWFLRRRIASDLVGQMDADVIGLQEAWRFQLRYFSAHHGDYEWRGQGRNTHVGGEHCSVGVRRSRFHIDSHRTMWFGTKPDTPGSRIPGAGAPRVATIVHLTDRESGRLLVVVDAHLDEASAERRASSIRQLLAELRPYVPTVVLGDLNGTEAERTLFDPLDDAGFVSALPPDAPGTAHRFRCVTDGPRIDVVRVNPLVEVVAGAVVVQPPGQRPASDHWPVRATLRLRQV
jgi:endonuclease/exonuclease/phosphatase family metal-dependent hydrolase